MCDGYGLADRAELVEAILWWQDRCWRGIDAGATAGDPALIRLRDHGAADQVRAAHQWTTAHRQRLESGIR